MQYFLICVITVSLISLVKSLVIPPSKTAKFSQLKRIIQEPLPSLYVYDHCPFCVRVRLAFGLKNIKYDLRFLANDDGMIFIFIVHKYYLHNIVTFKINSSYTYGLGW